MNDVLRQNLSDFLNQANAHVSIDIALKGVKPELRHVKPDEGLHSIWDELEHIRIALSDIVNYIFDPAWSSPKWPDEYWPENNGPVSDEEWDKSVAQISEDINTLSNLINNDKIDLTSIIPHTKEHTYLREILIAVDHNAYHLGQIVLLRKLLNNW